MTDFPRGVWEPVDEHADATAIANALHRDAIPLEERGYFLALVHNHIAMCPICAEEMKACSIEPAERVQGEAGEVAE